MIETVENMPFSCNMKELKDITGLEETALKRIAKDTNAQIQGGRGRTRVFKVAPILKYLQEVEYE